MSFRLAIVSLVFAVGCGDALVADQFLGRPLLQVGGPIVQPVGRNPVDHGDPRMAVFWAGVSSEQQLTLSQEQRANLEGQLAAYEMTLFDAPPPAATPLYAEFAPPEHRLGVGVIILYAETGDDQRFDPASDLLLGASSSHLIAWSATDIAPSDSAAALVGPMKAGFAVFSYDEVARCRFVDAENCEGQGSMSRTSTNTKVTLNLYERPEQVLVPSPAIDPMMTAPASIWAL